MSWNNLLVHSAVLLHVSVNKQTSEPVTTFTAQQPSSDWSIRRVKRERADTSQHSQLR